MQKTNHSQHVPLDEYTDLIQTVAKVEYSRFSHSGHLMEYSEYISIGAAAVYVILSSQPKANHNITYISTAIRWAIRNELRRRYKWYTLKHNPDLQENERENDNSLEISKEELREAVYETIFSIEELESSDNPLQVEDESLSPEQKIELTELKNAVKKAFVRLNENEKKILEARFFHNKKVKDIANEMNVSSARISKLVKVSLDKLKEILVKEGII